MTMADNVGLEGESAAGWLGCAERHRRSRQEDAYRVPGLARESDQCDSEEDAMGDVG